MPQRSVPLSERDTVVTLTIATSPAELDELFIARHRVFVDQQGYYPERDDRRIFDPQDFEPTTRNFIARAGESLIGGFRVVEASSDRIPIDDFYDFGPHLPPDCPELLACSMFFVHPEHRRGGWSAVRLVAAAADYMLARQVPYMLGAVSPSAERLLGRMGWEPLAPRFFHIDKKVWVTPMILDQSDRIAPVASRTHGRVERPIVGAASIARSSPGQPPSTAPACTRGAFEDPESGS